MKYTVIIESDSSYPREYESNSRNVLSLANEYGRSEYGETVTVTNRAGKAISRAIWDMSSRRYIRASV